VIRGAGQGEGGGLFRQPRSVWAVAFASVVSFMGIGLVDPILPLLRTELHATEAQVSLLFTSYFLVTAVFMLVTGWVSSRIGAKKTLILGLVLIVTFSALAGLSSGVSGIVWFRGGWGIGNALFIATALAAIVGAASGGFGAAIMLYEAALGLGIAMGPLVGGLLGGISWRGPFFGVTALMAIALILILTLLQPTPRPSARSSLADPFRALAHRGLLTLALVALLYNWAFFTVLGYAPYPMHVSVHTLGFIYTGWGVLVAVFAVGAAPRLQRVLGTAAGLYLSLFLMALDMTAIAIWVNDRTILITCVILSGAFIGLNNTLVTGTSMNMAPVPRPVASAAYSFVRFFGAGLAPYVASTLAARFDDHVPYLYPALCQLRGVTRFGRGLRCADQVAGALHFPPCPDRCQCPCGLGWRVKRREALAERRRRRSWRGCRAREMIGRRGGEAAGGWRGSARGGSAEGLNGSGWCGTDVAAGRSAVVPDGAGGGSQPYLGARARPVMSPVT
jgi:ACDE family multidrug resistance protein